MARARCAGSLDLKIPEPTNTASAPSCITSAASAGVAIPPAEKFGTGSLPCFATHVTRSSGAPSSFASCTNSSSPSVVSRFIWLDDRAHVPHRFHDIARARFALGANHRRAFGDAPQRFAQIPRAANERHLETVLPDVVLFVGGREHFALVDVSRLRALPAPALRQSGRCAPWPSPEWKRPP